MEVSPIYDEITEWENLPLHPLCSLFPEAVNEDYDRLVESMREHGFLPTDPVVLIDATPESTQETWEVLDGRNRLIAATDAGVKPSFVQFQGDDPLSFVVALNLNRRHLTTGQKAAVASSLSALAPDGSVDPNTMSKREAGKHADVSPKSISRYRAIERESPEVAEKVKSGEIGLAEAKRQLSTPIVDEPESAPTLGDKRKKKREEEQEEFDAEMDEVVQHVLLSYSISPDLAPALRDVYKAGFHYKR